MDCPLLDVLLAILILDEVSQWRVPARLLVVVVLDVRHASGLGKLRLIVARLHLGLVGEGSGSVLLLLGRVSVELEGIVVILVVLGVGSLAWHPVVDVFARLLAEHKVVCELLVVFHGRRVVQLPLLVLEGVGD